MYGAQSGIPINTAGREIKPRATCQSPQAQQRNNQTYPKANNKLQVIHDCGTVHGVDAKSDANPYEKTRSYSDTALPCKQVLRDVRS